MAKVAIHPEGTKIPTVPLTHGIRKGNILQVAGQVAFDPSTNEIVGTTVTEQTRQVMQNVRRVLEAGGATLDDVIMCRVYLTDTAHFGELNDAYREFFEESFPARTTVYVGLPEGLLVEIDALAVLD
ncbi:RidA family protein [Actinophytocola algeriensis]|jgi:reactive intermediate/imine deaminase|uniref:Reactive intermediate/imine deaminase n=1 Tax=Actinophytocola algeriensis TaxID=1768010 RepID=A0A7W7VGZ3_9PSEU|nr:RidA family protein [Actinophytocola algeriensis]MBB4909987.1 reactive intermediate/imine deaminase [Actinophytocola algeriensis]MBE1475977.1 reactive intermediate/imine deaminase [Actinophytocola algeriensis]